MIDFSHSFNAAWERMVRILFQPFDLGKWFVIGFSAFLAGLLNGGNSFNYNYSGNSSGSSSSSSSMPQQFHQHFPAVSSFFSALQIGGVILIVGAVMLVVFGFVALLYWLGARGQFLFLDNIVRNRAEIALPWRIYARQGNRVFVFHLVCLAASFGVILVMGIPILLLVLFGVLHQAHIGVAVVLGLVAFGIVYLILLVAFGIFLLLFREWAIPLMFRYDMTTWTALRELGALVMREPGSTAIFVLLRFALAIGFAVVTLMACIFTCCLEIIPYLGTVILLPALIFLRCFSLECLAQFGPQYNVWLADQPDAGALNPQLPPG